MTIQEMELVVKCDNCSNETKFYENYVSISIEKILSNKGWYCKKRVFLEDDRFHYCPQCLQTGKIK